MSVNTTTATAAITQLFCRGGVLAACCSLCDTLSTPSPDIVIGSLSLEYQLVVLSGSIWVGHQLSISYGEKLSDQISDGHLSVLVDTLTMCQGFKARRLQHTSDSMLTRERRVFYNMPLCASSSAE